MRHVNWIRHPAQLIDIPALENESLVDTYVRQYGTTARPACEYFESQHLDFVVHSPVMSEFIASLMETMGSEPLLQEQNLGDIITV